MNNKIKLCSFEIEIIHDVSKNGLDMESHDKLTERIIKIKKLCFKYMIEYIGYRLDTQYEYKINSYDTISALINLNLERTDSKDFLKFVKDVLEV